MDPEGLAWGDEDGKLVLLGGEGREPSRSHEEQNPLEGGTTLAALSEVQGLLT